MQVRVLGPLEAWDDGRSVELGAGRQRALLAVLALGSPAAISTDRLIEALWGDSPPPTAPKSLQNLVSQLRRSLGSDTIATRPPGYALVLDGDDLDARKFERLAAEGRRMLEDDARVAARTLREALELWRGPALVDFAYEDFAQAEITRLEELRIGALEDRVDADLAGGGGGQLVPELEALVSSHPLRERLRGQLMLALYRSGRQAEALEVYRVGRDALSKELGLEPGAALRQLETAILNQDPALGRPPTLRRPALEKRRLGTVLAVAALVLVAGALAVALAARGEDGPPVVGPNSLVKIDAATNEVVDVIAVGRSPQDTVVVGDYVLVSSASSTLTRVDMRTGETATSGASGADMGLAPAGDRYAWVASLQQDRMTRVDVESLEPLDSVPLPADLAYAFPVVGGGSLWVTEAWPPAVLRYGLPALQLERRYDFAFSEVTVEPVYGYGATWVVLGNSDALLRIDVGTGETTTIPVGPWPGPPAVGFGSIWTPSIQEGTLWRVDGVTGDAREVAEVGGAPFAAEVGAGSVWLTGNCDGTVTRVDAKTGAVVATVRTGHFPLTLAFGRGHAWVGIAAEPWNTELCG